MTTPNTPLPTPAEITEAHRLFAKAMPSLSANSLGSGAPCSNVGEAGALPHPGSCGCVLPCSGATELNQCAQWQCIGWRDPFLRRRRSS